MRICSVLMPTLLLACCAFPQQTPKSSDSSPSATPSEQDKLKALLESKVRAEWDAFKAKDKKAYGDLLVDDFIAVETDSQGARDKFQMISEIDRSAMSSYTLFSFRLITAGPDNALVTYEVSTQFPPKSTMRFLRVWASELWVKRDGQWKARYYQETRVK